MTKNKEFLLGTHVWQLQAKEKKFLLGTDVWSLVSREKGSKGGFIDNWPQSFFFYILERDAFLKKEETKIKELKRKLNLLFLEEMKGNAKKSK